MNLPILFQDEHLVAIDKPPGLLVHRSPIDKHETRFALQMLRDQIGQHVFPVHRLDRPTSGVLVFALNAEIARALNQQFALKQIYKHYYAIVRGHVKQAGNIDYALKEKLDKIADKMVNTDKAAQEAQTDYAPVAYFELPYAVSRYATARYSLVKLMPKTGRKHQLRRHMCHINHPIVGDTTHGDGKHNAFVKAQFDFAGLALTCQQMRLIHPVSLQPLIISAAFDPRMGDLLGQWGWQEAEFASLDLPPVIR